MPYMAMQHAEDPREVLTKALGDISSVGVFHNKVLVAIYVRPKVTKSGIHLTDATTDEDKTQGKVGLIVKMGDRAFEPDTKWSWPDDIGLGDWVFFRASDGWAINVHGTSCRVLDDVDIKGRIESPDQVW